MELDQAQETQLKQYLLGELKLEEQVLIEQRLFLDSSYAEFAQAVEDELIDDYVHNDLTDGERDKFERHFLQQTDHENDLRIAEALKRHLASDLPADFISPPATGFNVYERGLTGAAQVEMPNEATDTEPGPFSTFDRSPKTPRGGFSGFWAERRPVVWIAVAAAGLILVSLITWFAIQSIRQSRNAPRLQAEDQQPTPPLNQQQSSPQLPTNQRDQTAQTQDSNSSTDKPSPIRTPSQTNRPKNLPTQLAAFTLSPGGGLTRSGAEANRISVSSEVERVLFTLPVVMAGEYDSYSAKLRRGNRTLQNWPKLSSENDLELGKVVRLEVAAGLLSEQRYELTLASVSTDPSPEVTTYTFRVEKK